jgi:hypothetical protein
VSLERRYRLLLRAYPPAYRAARAAEITGTYLDLAGTLHRAGDERLHVSGAVGVSPPALQLPAEAHDTDKARAPPRWLRAAVPGTSMAACQVPFTSLATNACSFPELSV